jgi:uncharacterized damage-inducible protein DinB
MPEAPGVIATDFPLKGLGVLKRLLHTELDYSEWANRRLLQACEQLTPEEFIYDFGASHASIGGTLRHILYAERAWTARLVANSLPEFDLLGDPKSDPGPPLEPELTMLTVHWPPVWIAWHRWLADLSDDELDHEMSSTRSDGSLFMVARWQLALHMVNHSTMHRGQIVTMLRALGKQPPNTDLFTLYHAR